MLFSHETIHFLSLWNEFYSLGREIHSLMREFYSCWRIFFLIEKHFVFLGENFTFVEEIFSHWKVFCFLKREFLSDISKLFFLRWNRLWNKWAQKAAAKFSICWAWPSSAQLVLEIISSQYASVFPEYRRLLLPRIGLAMIDWTEESQTQIAFKLSLLSTLD